jgi:hypothetical protein
LNGIEIWSHFEIYAEDALVIQILNQSNQKEGIFGFGKILF